MLIGSLLNIKVLRIVKFPFALTSWLVLITGVAVAGITAANINRLNRLADNSSQNQILLICLKEQVSRTNSLELKALIKQEIDQKLEQELKKNQLEINQILRTLGYYHIHEQINNHEHELLHRAFNLYDQYSLIIKKSINSIKKNQVTQPIETAKIDQAYDELF
ncbi:MAG: hypothetical protein AB4372_09005, partial [Xenococcus sp. (in: cyanobacteria)]